MNLIRRLFPFRTCTLDIREGERALQRPCLLYHIKRCQAPCIEAIDAATYREDIAQIRQWTNKPVTWLVNTHWHFDHTLGNAAYVEAWPGVQIVATRHTQKAITAGTREPSRAIRCAAPRRWRRSSTTIARRWTTGIASLSAVASSVSRPSSSGRRWAPR